MAETHGREHQSGIVLPNGFMKFNCLAIIGREQEVEGGRRFIQSGKDNFSVVATHPKLWCGDRRSRNSFFRPVNGIAVRAKNIKVTEGVLESGSVYSRLPIGISAR